MAIEAAEVAMMGVQERKNVDVTIIGAGPTGLTTALLARKCGLSVCIVDQAEGPLPVGRADALNARTQQLLASVGVLPELLPNGLKCNSRPISLPRHAFKAKEVSKFNLQGWEVREPAKPLEFLMIGQPEVERAFIKHLDIPVIYSTPVESVEDKPTEAITKCRNLKISSKYVVAADGAHSQTRKQLGISFQGEKPNMRWAVLDTFLKTDFPVCDEIISLEKDGQSKVAWIPRERGLARFYVLLEGEVTQARAEESIREHMAPHTVEFERTEWFSTFDVQERVAETFISKENGRVLLAGDAAHVHSVNGGQGLNTGISDGFALAWRLNLACRGSSPGALKSYDEERRTTAKGVVEVAAKLVRSTMKTSEEYVKIIEKSAANITGMGINYDPITPYVVAGQAGSFIAGARCPDFPLRDPDGEQQFFYDLFEHGRFAVLLPSDVRLELPQKLTQHVSTWALSEIANGGYQVMREGEHKVLATTFDFGKAEKSAIVVRPDLYVGYVGSDPNSYFKGISK